MRNTIPAAGFSNGSNVARNPKTQNALTANSSKHRIEMPTYFNFHLQSENLNEFHSQPGCNTQPRIRYILMKRPSGRQIKIRRGLEQQRWRVATIKPR